MNHVSALVLRVAAAAAFNRYEDDRRADAQPRTIAVDWQAFCDLRRAADAAERS